MLSTTTQKILLDTSILIGYLRGSPEIAGLFSHLKAQKYQPCISVITLAEFEAGIKPSSLREKQKREFISQYETISLTTEMAKIAGQMLQSLNLDKQQKAGLFPDALIAATAEHLKIDICTANIKHFKLFPLIHSKIANFETL